MDLHLRLTTLLVLMLQAVNGVRLQHSSELPPLLDNFEDYSEIDIPPPSVGSNTLDVNTNTAKQGNMTNEVFQDVPMLNSTTPGMMENAINSLPASTTNDTAGNPITASPDILFSSTNDTSITSGSNHTGLWETGLPKVSNATISSPLTTTTKGWANNGTADAPNVTVTFTPESQDYTSSTTELIPGSPQVNSTSTSTPTITSSTYIPTPTTNTTSRNTKVKAGDSGNNTENNGFTHIDWNTKAWGAIIGTALAVGFVGFIIYILLKKKNGRFIHKKLIEDMPSEPVLRLDNGEPLDLKFDALAYYNPGVQGDHIQMTNFPQGHRH